jgi:hypothetical protein
MLVLVAAACQPEDVAEEVAAPVAEEVADPSPLKASVTLHASFDHGADADFALGDALLYTAPSYDAQDEAEPGIGNPDVAIAAGAGRFGDALEFKAKNTHAIFYKADQNVAHSTSNWSGTVSFWLSLDPAVDLAPGFCDPIQVTDSAYNDAAVWVDFTRDAPRQFRLGIFGDLEVWNPENLSANDFPFFLERVIAVDEPPFATGEWTHVVITFSGLGGSSGTANLYLNGQAEAKTMTGVEEPFTWDMSRGAVRLGVNYVGLFDELSLFDRALTAEEVQTLYELPGGVGSFY